MIEIVLLFHIIIAVMIVVLVLLQQGKGANMGAAFGSGASNTLFGSRGPASFLMKLTGVLVALFFATSLTLGHLASKRAHAQNTIQVANQPVIKKVETTAPVKQTAPVVMPQKQNNFQPISTSTEPQKSSK